MDFLNKSISVIDPRIIEEGKKIYKNNDYLRTICQLMKNKQFRTFFDDEMSDWDYLQCSHFFMKLYEKIELSYKTTYNGNTIPDEIMIYLIKNIMDTKEYRRIARDSYRGYQEKKYKNRYLQPYNYKFKRNNSF